MMRRIIADCIILLAVFYAPWWATILLVTCAVFLFREYWEALAVGLLTDLLYAGGPLLGGFKLVYTVGYLVLYFILTSFKKRTRFYDAK